MQPSRPPDNESKSLGWSLGTVTSGTVGISLGLKISIRFLKRHYVSHLQSRKEATVLFHHQKFSNAGIENGSCDSPWPGAYFVHIRICQIASFPHNFIWRKESLSYLDYLGKF